MKCLKKFKWVKLPRQLIPNAKGALAMFLLPDNSPMRCRHYYIPMDGFSSQLLRILTTQNWRERILRALFKREVRSFDMGSFTYDASVDGVYTSSFLYSNL